MSFQRLYPPPAFVIIKWYRQLDSNFTAGIGVVALPNTRENTGFINKPHYKPIGTIRL
jgi:hypothetical protein